MTDLTLKSLPHRLGFHLIAETDRGVEWLESVAPNLGKVVKGDIYFPKDPATAQRYADQAQAAGLIVTAS